MTRDQAQAVLLSAIARVAPEADLANIDPQADLREQLDLDSMDLLNIAVAIHDRIGIDIPEADYPKLATLDTAIGYLEAQASR